jgi:DNA-binding IclR family transcriptional regulator
MLLTLQDLGYVRQNPQNRNYQATIKFFELGQNVIRNIQLIDIARPHMIKLSKKVDENVNLGVLDGIDAVCVDRVEGQNPLKVDQPIGSRYPAYVSAFGKAMLAFLSVDERTQILTGHKIVKFTNKSHKSIASLETDLKKCRERGYALDTEEAIVGISCVGAPIFDHTEKVIAGISIAAPAFRLNKNKQSQNTQLIVKTASDISNDMGRIE